MTLIQFNDVPVGGRLDPASAVSLDKSAIEALAKERFGKGVRRLNKVEASGLIDELLETHGGGGGRQPDSGGAHPGRRTA